MNNSDKQKRLGQIPQEANLRELLMNLLDEMKLEPVLTHGVLESGKDIVCKEVNDFGRTEWVGFVVKLGKITGSTSDKGSLQTILTQVQEAFIHPYFDPKSKTKVYMSKVVVVSNDQILTTAREKIWDKLLSLQSGARANVHFVDGAELAELLDSRWSDFWKTHLEVLAVSDPMTVEIGKILYVVALAHTHHARPTKKKPAHLAREVIARQTGFDEETVAAGLHYLVQRQYLEPSGAEGFTLNRKLTAGRLLTHPSHIRLLELLSKKANSTRHLTWKQAKQVAKKSGLDSKFVKKTLGLFLRGSYLERDKSRRGKNHYIVNDGMRQDEMTYLKCWSEHGGALPQPGSA